LQCREEIRILTGEITGYVELVRRDAGLHALDVMPVLQAFLIQLDDSGEARLLEAS
jgi:hypothetical protein